MLGDKKPDAKKAAPGKSASVANHPASNKNAKTDKKNQDKSKGGGCC